MLVLTAERPSSDSIRDFECRKFHKIAAGFLAPGKNTFISFAAFLQTGSKTITPADLETPQPHATTP
jgi:hypothetical protein